MCKFMGPSCKEATLHLLYREIHIEAIRESGGIFRIFFSPEPLDQKKSKLYSLLCHRAVKGVCGGSWYIKSDCSSLKPYGAEKFNY